MRNSLTLKVLVLTILKKQNWRTSHPLTGTIFMHKTCKKRFPNEDSSGLFNQEKCATIHISRHRKQLSRRFHFQTFYIVQQLHRAINSFCRDCSSLRAIFFFFFKWWKLLDLSVPQKNVLIKDSPPRIFPGHPRFHLSRVPLTNQQPLIEKWNQIQLSSSVLSHAGTCNSADKNLKLKT